MSHVSVVHASRNGRQLLGSAQRCDTNQGTHFGAFEHVKPPTVDPILNRAWAHVTEKRCLIQRHHAALSFTPRAPRDNRTCNATGDNNLVRFNGDPGSPLAHVLPPFQALPATFGVINF